MPKNRASFKIAAVQATPVFLNREATVKKACRLIAEAGKRGAKLVVFPEAFIPTYPDWVWAVPSGEVGLHNELYAELLANSVDIPSAATDALCRAAKAAKTHVVMGLNERNVEASGASLYNTLLFIDDRGVIMGKHRKLVPTGGERLVWTPGDGSTLQAFDTPLGKIGALICWENYMPLARYAMYAWGTEIYLAPTWDRGQGWLGTLQHIAREGRVYVVGCCIALRKEDLPDRYEFKRRFYGDAGEWINVGDSAIVSPDGDFVAGPSRMKEEILVAEVDPARVRGSRFMFDVAGHYARPDVFQLTVQQAPRPMLHADGAPPVLAPRRPPAKRAARRT